MGGIAAGIVGGFLLLGAIAFFWVSRNCTPVAIRYEETSELETRIPDAMERKRTQTFDEVGGRLSSVN